VYSNDSIPSPFQCRPRSICLVINATSSSVRINGAPTIPVEVLKDVVRANKAGCLDHCAEGPSVVIYPEGVWYQVKSEADVTEIMERHVIKGEIVTRLIMPDHPAPKTLPPLTS
jgi:(2Fe-2S) ferredoxin